MTNEEKLELIRQFIMLIDDMTKTSNEKEIQEQWVKERIKSWKETMLKIAFSLGRNLVNAT